MIGIKRHATMPAAGALLLLLAAAFSAAPLSKAEREIEYGIKAGIIYNLAMFVMWPGDVPSQALRPVRVCILGKDPFGAIIDPIAKPREEGRRVTLRRIKSADRARACDILFISQSEEGRLAQILDLLGDAPVLTVGDVDGFTDSGGMVLLFRKWEKDGYHIKMDINLQAARRVGLRLRADLLLVAERPDGRR